uniref:Uncharacterized protein n=1 Tax=Arundo donax TaxID=35708 RepID=A0A0A9BFE0_ARUDO
MASCNRKVSWWPGKGARPSHASLRRRQRGVAPCNSIWRRAP